MTALATWRNGAAKSSILDFVARVSDRDGPDHIAPADRIAVFDNDGTLWCEKPIPIELGFVLQRLVEMAEADETLRTREPWRAARAGDRAWLGDAITKHYRGDDGDVEQLMAGILEAFAGRSVDEYAAAASAYLRGGTHPTLGCSFDRCSYEPMIELLDHLDANGFTSYIASGGDRDFMRPVTEDVYRIPAERVIGSSNALAWTDGAGGGAITYQAVPDVFDDGPVKPVRIWSRIGKRPILAAGNSDGDIPMLRYAQAEDIPSLSLLLLHDDDEREFAYTAGAEQALEQADDRRWTVVSMRNDWSTVFAAPDHVESAPAAAAARV